MMEIADPREPQAAWTEDTLDTPVVEVRHTMLVFVRRQPGRARCARCRIRRVLYRIAVQTVNHAPEFTEARCAECWGLAPEG